MQSLFGNPSIDKPYPVGEGIRKIYRFDNGYGASVVRFKILGFYGSYTSNNNEFELAVITFPDKDSKTFHLDYVPSITGDVLGHLSKADVEKVLRKIRKLPKLEG